LADKEQFEIDVLSQFMPTPLSDDELNTIITDTISELNATSMADMGKVMNAVKEKTVGRGDPSVISKLVKEQLK
ncbi:MAG: GatB/YqeY domain-containing protein, partial [Moraxella sp.]|nr:GatB/YqeY domain-containing protein [Moraxella sp.]